LSKISSGTTYVQSCLLLSKLSFTKTCDRKGESGADNAQQSPER
jgi:hypothetical protein